MLTGSLAAAAGLLTYDNTTVMLLNRSPSQAQAYLPLSIHHTYRPSTRAMTACFMKAAKNLGLTE